MEQIQANGSGIGFHGMRERARHFQAYVTIESNGTGTKVSLHCAVPPKKTLPTPARREIPPELARNFRPADGKVDRSLFVAYRDAYAVKT